MTTPPNTHIAIIGPHDYPQRVAVTIVRPHDTPSFYVCVDASGRRLCVHRSKLSPRPA